MKSRHYLATVKMKLYYYSILMLLLIAIGLFLSCLRSKADKKNRRSNEYENFYVLGIEGT